jgi:hypothetical protein
MVSQEVDTKEVASKEVASQEEEEEDANKDAPAQAEEVVVVTRELLKARWDSQAVTQLVEDI